MIVQIAAAFPGQFDVDQMLAMAVTELAWWGRQATRRVLENQMRALQAARSAMIDGPAFERITGEMTMQLTSLKLGRSEAVSRGWEELKAMGGR